jgi:hypothetical protein
MANGTLGVTGRGYTLTLDVADAVKKIVRLRRGNELRAAIRTRLREAGRPLLAAAKRNAPEDEGTLQRSIKLRAGRRSRRSIGVVVGPPSGRSALGIPADWKGYYPTHLELGTRFHREERWLRDAMDETVRSSERILGKLGLDILAIAKRP